MTAYCECPIGEPCTCTDTDLDTREAATHLTPWLRLVVRDNPHADLYQATVLALRLMADTADRNINALLTPVHTTDARSYPVPHAWAHARFGGTYDEFRDEAGVAS